MEWIGDSYPDSFSVEASDIGLAINERRKWISELDLEEYDDSKVFRPVGDDSRQNSKASNDVNWLHKYDQIAEEVAEEYNFLNSPVQESALVNQGMSIADIVVPAIESDLGEVEGIYTAVIYAAEDGNPDEVVIEEDENSVDVEVRPGGKSDSFDAAQLLTEESDENYEDHHNEHLVAVMDLAVGRGRNTPGNTRNGELLQNNRIRVNEEVDWNRVSELEFDLREKDESMEYRVDVIYEDGEKNENALTYEEISTYLQGFEELDSVEERKEESESRLPVQGIMALSPQGIYLNSLSATNAVLEASAQAFASKSKGAD